MDNVDVLSAFGKDMRCVEDLSGWWFCKRLVKEPQEGLKQILILWIKLLLLSKGYLNTNDGGSWRVKGGVEKNWISWPSADKLSVKVFSSLSLEDWDKFLERLVSLSKGQRTQEAQVQNGRAQHFNEILIVAKLSSSTCGCYCFRVVVVIWPMMSWGSTNEKGLLGLSCKGWQPG